MPVQVLTRPEQSIPASGFSGFSFGDQQGRVLSEVEGWLSRHRRGVEKQQVWRLFGFAGSGKTTLAKHLAASVGGRVCFAAYTGKAALMLARNGCVGACTIHSLLYKTEVDSDGVLRFRLNRRSPARKAALIVIDECSMVDEVIGHDLLSLGVPILVLGDPAQLPPVSGKGFFTHGCAPDAMLTEIHRQARENPIIRFATDVREGRALPYGEFGSVIIDRRGRRSVSDVLEADQIIVGRNATRQSFNTRIRRHLGRKSITPVRGDRLVCLRNDTKAGVMNGEIFNVEVSRSVKGGKSVAMRLKSEDFTGDGPRLVRVRKELFDGTAADLKFSELRGTQHFDYGYALTGHKSQGSQWKHVMAYDESATFGADGARWLYTVITRASEKLTLIR